MITIIREGNILESKAQTLVNTVNCEGVMGKGIALEFKKRFPAMFRDYEKRCKEGLVKIGKPYLFESIGMPKIINFPTKQTWRSSSKIADIKEGLSYLQSHYLEWGVTSIAVPPLGCGQGGLDWADVGPILYEYLSRLEIPVELYAPHEVALELTSVDYLSGGDAIKPAIGVRPEFIVLAAILERIVNTKYHWPVGRTSFQKIAYFATALGLPSGLTFRRSSYGPYSDDLKRAIQRMINSELVIETSSDKNGNLIMHLPGPKYQQAKHDFAGLLAQWNTVIDRVTDLFLRIRTTNQAELYATVHKSASDLTNGNGKELNTELDVFNDVLEWKLRHRSPIQKHELALAIRDLNLLGWIRLKVSEELPVADY
ncbi:MAG: macro domain-containing protein [bacterium]|jgi:O-acetyl-ADP-ribose deacetylase (regulator of RNase III)/uncharacterized protein YwgA